MRHTLFAVGTAMLLAGGCSVVQETMDSAKSMVAADDAGPSVRIISPADGATVSSPVLIQFGLSGMGVAPAGTEMENTGHHHLIIDAPLPDMSLPVPATDNYRHFGAGQTEVSLELAPGTHTLQLLMGDYIHIPHEQPVYSDVVTITVK
ncbi:MAG: DUF4399 domain-containing protein [Pseudomonadota bacterium]